VTARRPPDLIWLVGVNAAFVYIESICELLTRPAPRHEPEVEAAKARRAATPQA
jgi:hypothetical protein